MDDQPTRHGYAVNVKDRAPYTGETRAAMDTLGERRTEALYAEAQEAFWTDAQEIARAHGFERVDAEGRSGGWAVPYPQPMDEREECEACGHAVLEAVRGRRVPGTVDVEVVAERCEDCGHRQAAEHPDMERFRAFASEIEVLLEASRATFEAEVRDEANRPTSAAAWVLAQDENDPDTIGQSEYRAVYDVLADALEGAEPGTEDDLAEAVLDEIRGHAQEIARAIREEMHRGRRLA